MGFRKSIVAISLGWLLLPGPLFAGERMGRAEPGESASQAASAPTEKSSAGAGSWNCLDFAHSALRDNQRVRAVRDFLSRHQCPIEHLAPVFVVAAELNGIDYRLLPTLAVLESGCGRNTRNHNLFGWAKGRKPFPDFEQAIHFVAQRLRLAPHYAGKTTLQKLRMYNRRGAYRAKILRVMETIGAEMESEEAGGD